MEGERERDGEDYLSTAHDHLGTQGGEEREREREKKKEKERNDTEDFCSFVCSLACFVCFSDQSW